MSHGSQYWLGRRSVLLQDESEQRLDVAGRSSRAAGERRADRELQTLCSSSPVASTTAAPEAHEETGRRSNITQQMKSC